MCIRDRHCEVGSDRDQDQGWVHATNERVARFRSSLVAHELSIMHCERFDPVPIVRDRPTSSIYVGQNELIKHVSDGLSPYT